MLYGMSFASFLFHIFLVLGALALLKLMGIETLGGPFYLRFIPMMMVGTLVTNFLLLLAVHATTCSGVKDVLGVLKGASVSIPITVGMSILPFLIEPVRLLISQIVMTHKHLASKERIALENIAIDAAVATFGKTEGLPDTPAVQVESIDAESLPEKEYALQTLKEARLAASYLAAFAGVYGMAIGSLWTNDCKKSG